MESDPILAVMRKPSRPIVTAVAIAVALPLAAIALYMAVGDPRAVLSDRASVESPATVKAELERHLALHPRDARGHVLLARIRMDENRFAEAVQSYEAALASSKVASDAGIWCEYADALGMAQGGTLAGKPSEMIAKALVLDPNHPKALEMAGSAAYERRDFAAATRHWRTLLQSMPVDAPGRAELEAAVERANRQQ
jgi:cytochrome c-type biogenesis protein CcmH